MASASKYPEIVLVTGNEGKLKEFRSLAPAGMTLANQKLDLDEIQSLDMREITAKKLLAAYGAVGKPVIVEDVSAGLDSLNGLPGPFVKFFNQRLGKESLYRLQKVENDVITILCIAGFYDGTTMLFGEGLVTGHVVAPRGQDGFGFDFVVVPDGQPDGQTLTFSEMGVAAKNAIGHRGKAFRALLDQLQGYYAA